MVKGSYITLFKYYLLFFKGFMQVYNVYKEIEQTQYKKQYNTSIKIGIVSNYE